MKTPIAQPKTSMSAQALALISQAVPDRDIYKMLVEGMEYELRAAEHRGIERAAHVARCYAADAHTFGAVHTDPMKAQAQAGYEIESSIRALAQGGENNA